MDKRVVWGSNASLVLGVLLLVGGLVLRTGAAVLVGAVLVVVALVLAAVNARGRKGRGGPSVTGRTRR